ncbi:unnamed protein product [Caenorhabditis brenneri]
MSWWRHVRKYAIVLSYILVPLYFLPPQIARPDQVSSIPIVLTSLPCLPELPSGNRELYVVALDIALASASVAVAEATPCSEVATFLFLNIYHLVFAEKPSGLSKKTVQMQHKLIISLIVQSSVTVVLFLTPVNAIIFFVLLGYQNQLYNNLIVFALAVHGIASTLIMIIAHKPYRDFVFYPVMRHFEKPTAIAIKPSFQSVRSIVES